MKKYLVINIEDANDNYLVDDLTGLIIEIYEAELVGFDFKVVKERFFNCYKVFVSESDIIELTKDVE
jgi:hypothetical protein